MRGADLEADEHAVLLGVVDRRQLDRPLLTVPRHDDRRGRRSHAAVGLLGALVGGDLLAQRLEVAAHAVDRDEAVAGLQHAERRFGVVARLISACGSLMPFAQTSAHRIRNASTMFTAGPAPITKIRFHTGCR